MIRATPRRKPDLSMLNNVSCETRTAIPPRSAEPESVGGKGLLAEAARSRNSREENLFRRLFRR
ncbi:hypothetical protein H5P28_14825 [Ruficoccus amylovorans]|uniref:Uncharacterized protein n=1 Tax=Ruficoccus amylovorans TaxID=1804625 RepID=A0A842HHR4_9BACT|nr:hypothetical protein [Ruficoccus amylovorans]MBC2595538.1 hypothetical protein [Ruficoccus amylovorans]